MRLSRHRPFRWMIRRNKDRTEGVVWRMFNSRGYAPAPCVEGRITRGATS